jgi:hypothetical protein
MVHFIGVSVVSYRVYRVLSYGWYVEYCCEFGELALISAVGDMSGLTVLTVNRMSLKHEVLSLQIHSYQLLHKNTK